MPDTTAPRGALIHTTAFLSPTINPYGLGNVLFDASPSFMDIDDDGDLDALVGNGGGNTLVYLNTGITSSPAFAAASTNPYGLGDVGYFASPCFVDIEGDGDLDAFIGDSYGNTLVYLNTGTTSSPAFAAATTNPYGLGDVGDYASPNLADIDGDGDLDAFIGNGYGNTLVYLNTGTASSPAFAAATTNPYGLGDVGYSASPSFVDIDHDGDLDAFIGNYDGNTLVYLNTGTANSPAFAAATTNPYGLGDVGSVASPSLVDIDNDGDLDAFIGNGSGNTRFFINTANPVAPVTSTTANGTYRVGSVITLTVAFNENVIVNTSGGKPGLALETGATDRFATYVSGSGTSTLTFRYTVKTGDSSADLDFLSSSALTLNGGTIKDAAGNNAILTLAAPGAIGSLAASKALVIDGINDVLNGTTGADNLNGGVGADTMTGGQGDDVYYVDNAGDKVVETDASALGGTDTVNSYLTTYTLTGNVERGVIKTSGVADLTGNTLGNSLYGGAGDNTLSGLAGNDYLNGGAGKDKLVGGQGADTMVGSDGNDAYYVENAGDVVTETQANAEVGGTDTVYSYLTAYTLTNNVERGVINSSGAADLTGNALANSLYGNTSNNKLTGAAGNDYLSGDAGDDVLSGGSGIDKLVGGTGADRLTGGFDADTFVIDSAGGRDVIYDFSFAEGDKISLRGNLNGSGITSGATALAHVSDVGGKAVLDIGDGNIVILLGVLTAELSASDFAIF
ncbi:MAG: FG-GAP-like repeat-containing protein [Pseudomonadota bacterium]